MYHFFYIQGCIPPWPMLQHQQNRGERAMNKSAKFIEDTMQWHVSRIAQSTIENNMCYQQLLSRIVQRNNTILNQNHGIKSITMNQQQTNDLQYKMNLSHGQMDVLQKHVRASKNKILLTNRSKMNDFRKKFDLDTAEVHKLFLQVVQHLVKKSQMPLQECNVYHCDKFEAFEALIQAAIDRSKFSIPQPLCQSQILLEISYDKSSAGLIESVAAGVTTNFHGKYGSIITTLAPDKIKESYNNYRELAIHWNKQENTNCLLRFPSIIVLACVYKHNDNSVCANTRVVMLYMTENIQNAVNDRYQTELANIESPSTVDFVIDKTDIEKLLIMPKDTSPTADYWKKINSMIHLPAFYAVALPDGINTPAINNQQLSNGANIINQSWKLWNIAKNNDCSDDSSSESDSDNEGGIVELNSANNVSQAEQRKPGIRVSSSSDNNNNSSDDNNNNNNNDDIDHDLVDETHILHDLNEYIWNANSNLTRMTESAWNWQCTHVTCAKLQGNIMYLLKYEAIFGNENNTMLPNENNQHEMLYSKRLFQNDGFLHFWLHDNKIPEENINNNEYFFAICDSKTIFGILQCFMTQQIETNDVNNPNYNNRKFVIQQRRELKHELNIDDLSIFADFCQQDRPYPVSLNDNLDDLKNIIPSVVDGNNCAKCHVSGELKIFRYDGDGYIEFDNKARNTNFGFSTSSCNNPCATCNASKQAIRSFPTPVTMSFESRSTADTIAKVAMKDENAIHNMGCQKVPIYDAPVHKQGPTPMHNAQGEFAVGCNTFEGFICACSNGDTLLKMEQEQLKQIQAKYERISHLQDLKHNEDKINSPDIAATIRANDQELAQLSREYDLELQNWQQRMQTTFANNHKSKFLQIMQKYHINLYYCMDNSVQGKMCQRICKARKEIVSLAKEIDFTSGILWEHFWENLTFVYTMTKRQKNTKYNIVDLATLKQAYINLYHQTLLIVKLWRQKGKSGMKIHYTMHDIEHCMRMFMSNGRHDDERFEAVNQHCQESAKLYQGWNGNRHGCKQLFVARRLNARALSCG